MNINELKSLSVSEIYYDTASQLQRFIYKQSEEAFLKGDADRDGIISIKQVEARRSFIRESLIKTLGGIPEQNTPLNERTTGILECEGFSIEKVIFESRPKAYVTSNLYLPHGIKSPCGAVLFLCGHWEAAKHKLVASRHYDSKDIISILIPGLLRYFDLPDICEELS